MQYFNFKRLIEKYSHDISAQIPSERHLDDAGEWQGGEPIEVTIHGAALNHRESKIFRSEGTLTGKDKALYMLVPLEKALHGAKIIDGGEVYSVGDELQNGEFTGVWCYGLKYCSAFDKEATMND